MGIVARERVGMGLRWVKLAVACVVAARAVGSLWPAEAQSVYPLRPEDGHAVYLTLA